MQPVKRLAYSVEEAAEAISCGRTSVFELIRTGQLRAVKVFGRTLITDDDLRATLATLPCARKKSAGPAERQDRRVSVEKLLSPPASLPDSRRTRNAVGQPERRGQHDDPLYNVEVSAPDSAVRCAPDDVGQQVIDRHLPGKRGVQRGNI
jgi:excisionase family DNA binding protein